MIPRYSRPEMTAIWEPENRFRIWLEIEALATEALEETGAIPPGVAHAVRERGAFDIARIDEIERETRHDVIAFLTNLAEHVGPEARFVHQGLTSSDVLDTCLAVQLKQASAILLDDLDALLGALKRRAFEHRDTLCIGRSHGIHAEPTTFGVKLAGFYAEFDAGARPAGARRRGCRDLQDLGRGRHLRQCRSRGRGACRAPARPHARADLHADHPARPPRVLFRHARRDRELGRAAGARDPPSAAHRGRARPRSISRRARRARRPCRTSAIRCWRKISPASRASCAPRWCRRSRTWRSGTSATSPIPRSSASSGRTRRSRSISRWRA